MARIGLLGGAFDPPHFGHIAVAQAVRKACSLDRVDLLVTGEPPHRDGKSVSAAAAHRVEMARLAVVNEEGLGVEDCETSRPGKSYTIETVRHLQAAHPDVEYTFIIGGDMLAELPRWRDVHELLARVDFVPVFRPGYTDEVWSGLVSELGADVVERLQANVVEMPLLDVSSTGVREALAGGESVRQWLKPTVEAYIRAHRLYVAG
jgi:nicotinate-nucleotide adenylyltransferase